VDVSFGLDRVELGYHKQRPVAGHEQVARPLVGERREPGDVPQIISRRQGQQVDARGRHPIPHAVEQL